MLKRDVKHHLTVMSVLSNRLAGKNFSPEMTYFVSSGNKTSTQSLGRLAWVSVVINRVEISTDQVYKFLMFSHEYRGTKAAVIELPDVCKQACRHAAMCVTAAHESHCHYQSASLSPVSSPDVVLSCPRAPVCRPSEPAAMGHCDRVIRPHLPGLHSVIAPVRSNTGKLSSISTCTMLC